MINTIKELKEYMLKTYGKYNITYDTEAAKSVIINGRRFKFPLSEEQIKRVVYDKNWEDWLHKRKITRI